MISQFRYDICINHYNPFLLTTTTVNSCILSAGNTQTRTPQNFPSWEGGRVIHEYKYSTVLNPPKLDSRWGLYTMRPRDQFDTRWGISKSRYSAISVGIPLDLMFGQSRYYLSPSKIMERIIYERIYDHLEEYSLLDDSQFGFRASRGTNDAVFKLVNDIYRARDNDEIMVSCFLTYGRLLIAYTMESF